MLPELNIPVEDVNGFEPCVVIWEHNGETYSTGGLTEATALNFADIVNGVIYRETIDMDMGEASLLT